MSECVELLKDLIAIPSVNPAYGGPGEGGVQAFVESWLLERSIDFRIQEVFPGRNNVIARIGPEDKPAILIEAHMDTVAVEGWTLGSPYEAIEKDRRLYGRGSCDTKGSLATFMLLAERLANRSDSMEHALVFAATVDEEYKQRGGFKLVELAEELRIVAAITGEPTRSSIITKHKGACRYSIEATGKAAHGSTPELGENAICKMARIIERLERYGELLGRDESKPFIETGTLNVGKIEGGTGFNIVPDRCVIDLDCRLGVNDEMEDLREELQTIVDSETGVAFETFLERPPLNTDNENWFPQALQAAARSAGFESDFGEVAFMTNGVAYSSLGLPTVAFGPGDIGQAHKTDEFIELGEMERSLAILEKLFQ